MVYLEPLKLLVASILVVYALLKLGELLLWSIFEPWRVADAIVSLEKAGEKILELRLSRSRRAVRKAALLSARLYPHRKLLLRVGLLRGFIYVLTYVASSSVLSIAFPYAYPAPAYIPLLTIPYKSMSYFTPVQTALLALLMLTSTSITPPRLRTGGVKRG